MLCCYMELEKTENFNKKEFQEFLKIIEKGIRLTRIGRKKSIRSVFPNAFFFAMLLITIDKEKLR